MKLISTSDSKEGPVIPRKPEEPGSRSYKIPTYSEEELLSFDNRENLKPAPYKYAFKPMLKGLEIGDPLFDQLPTSALACHGKSATKELPIMPEPDWVDWKSVRRGQELWLFHLGRVFSALGGELLAGFSIARFAVVLYKNGYAQDGKTAMSRYMHTGFAIVDWYTHELSDPKSRARQSIATTRAMHAFARRNSKELFDRSKGEGIALSQMDMAEVQLGFTAVCIDIIENELGYGNMHREDIRDMVHCWRLIGYHLGIQDEYNACSSVDRMDALMADYMAFTPRRFECPCYATQELRRTAIEGFAMTTGLGENFWYAVLDRMYVTKRMNLQHLRPPPSLRKYLPGVDVLVDYGQGVFKYEFLNAMARKQIVAQREEFLHEPNRFVWRSKLARSLSLFTDNVTWRAVSFLYRIRTIILLYLCFRLGTRILHLRKLIPSN